MHAMHDPRLNPEVVCSIWIAYSGLGGSGASLDLAAAGGGYGDCLLGSRATLIFDSGLSVQNSSLRRRCSPQSAHLPAVRRLAAAASLTASQQAITPGESQASTIEY
eukprot:scaffold67722_cov34-Phaeocystis_antarctica.AAC.2